MKNLFCCLILIFGSFAINTCFGQDWANLERYRVENNEPHFLNGPKVIFMGNSITEGWVNMRPDFFFINGYFGRGIGGQTTPQMLVRFRPDVIDQGADVVVILAGTNDIAGNTGPMTLDEIMGNIKSMAELAKANDIKVVLCSVLPAYDYPWKPGMKPNEKIPALNELIKAFAIEKGHVYLDYFSTMADERNGLPKKYADDEVHPTIAGYKVMEPMVKRAIMQALNSK
jgi:lysophospholipase L1-like esterase